MPDRPVMVSLDAPGVEPVRVAGIFDQFTPVQRVRRSGAMLLIAIALAATLIPIPIIHLLGIPLILLIGIVLAIRQLTFTGRLHALKIPCPKCGEPNRIGGGLGRTSTAPRTRNCDSCRRVLTLHIDGVDDATVAEGTSRTS